jgi:hypothetical protein
MTTSRDPHRLIRAFLAEGQTDLSAEVYDAVRLQIDHTSQRVVIGPWRTPFMGNTLRIGLAAAVAVLIAALGFSLWPNGSNFGSDVTLSPSPSLRANPSSPPPAAFPAGGELAAGRYSMIRGGVPLYLSLPTSGWESSQGFFINKDTGIAPDGLSFLFWDPSPVGVYADPCAQRKGQPAGPSTADLAEAMSSVPGTDLVSRATDVIVGGHPAKYVVIKLPRDSACPGRDRFYLWYGSVGNEGRYATKVGATYRLWIVDVDGTRLVIEAETYERPGDGPAVEQEAQQIVRSIEFEQP